MNDVLKKRFNALKIKRDKVKKRLNLNTREMQIAWKNFQERWQELREDVYRLQDTQQPNGQQLGLRVQKRIKRLQRRLMTLNGVIIN